MLVIIMIIYIYDNNNNNNGTKTKDTNNVIPSNISSPICPKNY